MSFQITFLSGGGAGSTSITGSTTQTRQTATQPRTQATPTRTTSTSASSVPTTSQNSIVNRAISVNTPGGSLSPRQIAQAAFDAGFRGEALVEIVAIALAESNGNPSAVNPRGELSIGLTQINIDPTTAWGRARAQRYGGQQGLMDPLQNMRAAFEISNQGRNFRPWSVHRSSPSPHAGASNRFLQAARSASQEVMTVVNRGDRIDYSTGDPRAGRFAVGGGVPDDFSPSGVQDQFGGLGFNDPGAPRTAAEIEDFIREHYGHLAWALDHDEIGPLLRRAAQNQWSPARLQGALFDTRWWQKTGAAEREWAALEGQDPAEADRRIESTMAEMRQRLERLGVPVHQAELRTMARDSLRFGWDQAEIASATAAFTRRRGMRRTMEAGGEIAQFANNAQGLSRREFFLPMTERQAFNHALRMVEGTGDMNTVRQSLVNPAASRFSDFAERIQTGETPREIFDPYIALGAELLEMDPENIDPLGDSRFSPMTDHVSVDGDRRAMTMSEWSRHVRRLDDFRATSHGMREAAGLAQQLVQIFGRGVF